MSESRDWFYERNGERIGPVSDDEMTFLVKEGKAARGTLVWRKGFSGWMKIEATELTVHLPEIPQTTTPEDDAPPPLPAASADTPPSLPVPDVPGEWWYSAENGERKGPISGRDLGVLLRNGGIKYGSNVWRQGFQEWQKAEDTDLLRYLQKTSSLPVHGAKVNNTLVWCVAFVPLVGLFIVPTLAAVLDDIMMANLLFFGTVNTVFCCIDASNLKKAGYDTGKWVLWSLVLVPVYLYVRAKRLKDDYSYFIAWCVVFVIMTVLSVSV